MITYLISSNFSKKISPQYYRRYNFPCFRSSHWKCSVRKGVPRNFAKFTGKHLWKSLFFNKVAAWGDCFWSFLCLLSKISYLFHLMEFKYLLFCSSRFAWRQRFQFDQKVCSKEFDVAFFMVRGISLRKSFWMVNTWRTSVRKRLKGSNLSISNTHTFLTNCCTKPCPRFF